MGGACLTLKQTGCRRPERNRNTMRSASFAARTDGASAVLCAAGPLCSRHDRWLCASLTIPRRRYDPHHQIRQSICTIEDSLAARGGRHCDELCRSGCEPRDLGGDAIRGEVCLLITIAPPA